MVILGDHDAYDQVIRNVTRTLELEYVRRSSAIEQAQAVIGQLRMAGFKVVPVRSPKDDQVEGDLI